LKIAPSALRGPDLSDVSMHQMAVQSETSVTQMEVRFAEMNNYHPQTFTSIYRKPFRPDQSFSVVNAADGSKSVGV